MLAHFLTPSSPCKATPLAFHPRIARTALALLSKPIIRPSPQIKSHTARQINTAQRPPRTEYRVPSAAHTSIPSPYPRSRHPPSPLLGLDLVHSRLVRNLHMLALASLLYRDSLERLDDQSLSLHRGLQKRERGSGPTRGHSRGHTVSMCPPVGISSIRPIMRERDGGG
jgi:hypothetical protein